MNKEKTVVSLSMDEIRKERYFILQRGINMALKEIGSDVQVQNVKSDGTNLNMEFSHKEYTPAQKEALLHSLI